MPEFNGTVAFADLNYTLRERTRFSVAARRDLEYSYLVGQHDYVVAEVTVIGDAAPWRVVGRRWIPWSWPPDLSPTEQHRNDPRSRWPIPDETVLSSSVDVGYNIGRTRVGFHLEHRGRQASRSVWTAGTSGFELARA